MITGAPDDVGAGLPGRDLAEVVGGSFARRFVRGRTSALFGSAAASAILRSSGDAAAPTYDPSPWTDARASCLSPRRVTVHTGPSEIVIGTRRPVPGCRDRCSEGALSTTPRSVVCPEDTLK